MKLTTKKLFEKAEKITNDIKIRLIEMLLSDELVYIDHFNYQDKCLVRYKFRIKYKDYFVCIWISKEDYAEFSQGGIANLPIETYKFKYTDEERKILWEKAMECVNQTGSQRKIDFDLRGKELIYFFKGDKGIIEFTPKNNKTKEIIEGDTVWKFNIKNRIAIKRK